MANILLFSENETFKTDLQMQISRYADGSTFSETNPDIMVVDENKTKFLELRKNFPSVPLIFLGENSCFAEDNLNIFIKKPFSLMSFLDTLLAANNKLDNSTDGYLFFNGYELRPSQREIKDTQSGEMFRLTEKEVDILKYLYKMSDTYVSKNDLQKNVWGYNEDVTTHTIETHIYRLRQKIESSTQRILITTDNGGYKLQTEKTW